MTATSTHNESASIGKTLKSLREGKSISLTDIAMKMHLDVRFIAAIEEDNFDALPDPIYVRGYIRSYSKLVDANADALVRIYEQRGGNFEPEIIPEIRHSPQTSSSDRPVKAFTYLITLALVILLIAWWQSNFVIQTTTSSPQEIAALREEQLAATVPEPAVPPQLDYQSSYTMNNLQEIPVVPMDSGDGSTGNVMEQLPGALAPADALAVDTMTATGATTVPAALSSTQTPVTNRQTGTAEPGITPDMSPSIQQTVLAVQTPAYQTTGPDLIVLRLSADSWMEITDSTGTKVFFNLGRTGDVFNVRGTAPFDVLLGFAQAVSLEYNGRPFNVAPYSRSGVARFTLGQ